MDPVLPGSEQPIVSKSRKPTQRWKDPGNLDASMPYPYTPIDGALEDIGLN